jgi:hypothetical protein
MPVLPPSERCPAGCGGNRISLSTDVLLSDATRLECQPAVAVDHVGSLGWAWMTTTAVEGSEARDEGLALRARRSLGLELTARDMS